MIAGALPQTTYAPLVIARDAARSEGQRWAVVVCLTDEGVQALKADGAPQGTYCVGETVECYSSAETAGRAHEEFADLGDVIAVYVLRTQKRTT